MLAAGCALLLGWLKLPDLTRDRTEEQQKGKSKEKIATDRQLVEQLRAQISKQAEVLALQGKGQLTVGILGGSISAGESVPLGESYAEVLSASGAVRVLNRAIPASGVAMPSFCVDALLPEETDALVIEFAANDGHFQRWHTESLVSGDARESRRLDPLASMERLVRHVRRSRPRTTPLVLYLCPSARPTEACEGLYSRVAAAYGVQQLSIAALLGSAVDERVHWNMQHPDAAGHAAGALLVLRALSTAAREGGGEQQATSPPLSLPPPTFLPAWENPHREWQCSTCDWSGCEGLQPSRDAAAFGFEVRGFDSKQIAPSRGASNEQVRKAGWVARHSNASVAFAVPANARVLVALLCSYENVGTAELGFTEADGRPAPAAGPAAWRSVDLRWSEPSSQQCVVDAGVSPAAQSPWLWVRAQAGPNQRAGANQVKVFGVYSQPRHRPVLARLRLS